MIFFQKLTVWLHDITLETVDVQFNCFLLRKKLIIKVFFPIPPYTCYQLLWMDTGLWYV